jgi:hypothetical protein
LTDQTEKLGRPQDKTIQEELTVRWLLGASAALVLAYLAVIVLSLLFGAKIEKLGQFGDSFGALTSFLNSLAFAAVVATVVLQSRELRESREQLVEQAKAQKAWAEAATKQIALTKELEFARSRPFIQSAWVRHTHDMNSFDFVIRNVGLGVAIVQAVELRADDKLVTRIASTYLPEIRHGWMEAIRLATTVPIDTPPIKVIVFDLDNYSRVLSPGEDKTLVNVSVTGSLDAVNAAYLDLCRRLDILIRFKSVNGESLSTITQFDYLNMDLPPLDPRDVSPD